MARTIDESLPNTVNEMMQRNRTIAGLRQWIEIEAEKIGVSNPPPPRRIDVFCSVCGYRLQPKGSQSSASAVSPLQPRV
jgi:hypothetical protein